MTGRAKMTFTALETLMLGWPGVVRATSYGTPALKVGGKLITRLKEDGDTIVIGGVPIDERDMLIATQGDVFYVTDHYLNHAYVLMRLSKAEPAQVEAFMRRRWREVAPKKLLAAEGAVTSSPAPVPARRKKTSRVATTSKA